MSGTPPQLCVKTPVNEVAIFKTHDAHVEEGHEAAFAAIRRIRSLQPPGFTGSSAGVTDEDPTVGVHISGWNSIEVRHDPEPPRLHGN